MYWLRIALFSIIDSEDEGSNNYVIARFLLEHFNELPGVSLTEISKQCNLSKAAVSRFCKELGLMDYIDLQMLIRTSGRKERSHQKSLTAEEQKQRFAGAIDLVTEEFKKAMDSEILEELIGDLQRYEKVYAFGHLQASHIAYTLGNNLAMFNKFCFTAQSWPKQVEKLEQATSKDLFIIFSASGDYFKRMDMNMMFLEKTNAPKVYLITFDNAAETGNGRLNRISLGARSADLKANMAMNMFVNYLSYRYSKLVSFSET